MNRDSYNDTIYLLGVRIDGHNHNQINLPAHRLIAIAKGILRRHGVPRHEQLLFVKFRGGSEKVKFKTTCRNGLKIILYVYVILKGDLELRDLLASRLFLFYYYYYYDGIKKPINQ